ncbi:ribonuclease H-like domain-containing protein [Jeotgalibacillus sp. ET6]|uniref:ribonuclease H-like domain-containing protein n=1 Tax=Jeotgalibacillus sp. ET6 TaxID=3037260 RepID=UPI0024184B4E|nr:ribonuclease H-like domain-containing protein [Jeotgalibacillus sp. ET6]MDG5470606.1 ribonuclease H-like domain-containing protein [Jeotgalibacillus sp. ET6]
MSLKNKLKRMKTHLSDKEKEPEKHLKNAVSEVDDEAIPYKEIWEENDVSPFWADQEYCLIREVRYPLTFKQGRYELGECFKAVEAWNNSDYKHPLSAKRHSLKDLFFFDTETTGLRGVGSTIFMLGYAQFTDSEVILKQHVLTHPGYEVPLYLSFLENVDYSTLVTYNGKSFDWPQVKSRHTLIRDHVPKLPETGHFDLYHASRRLWKHKMESVKLTDVEKHILKFERQDDLPGYLAPAIYFDFVERKHPEGIIKVLDHNEKDILSLISLYTHITFQLLGQDQEQTSYEKVEAGKWYKAAGDHAASRLLLEQAYSEDLQNYAAAHSLAFSLKKKGEIHEAAVLWMKVCENGSPREKRESAIELAKYYEHHEKNTDYAIQYTQKARESLIDDETIKSSVMKNEMTKIHHRLQRLNRK